MIHICLWGRKSMTVMHGLYLRDYWMMARSWKIGDTERSKNQLSPKLQNLFIVSKNVAYYIFCLFLLPCSKYSSPQDQSVVNCQTLVVCQQRENRNCLRFCFCWGLVRHNIDQTMKGLNQFKMSSDTNRKQERAL